MSIGGTPIPDPDPTGEYPDGWSGGHPDHTGQLVAGIYSHPEQEDIEVQWPVRAAREFFMLSDDIWEGVGVVDGTDYLVTAKALADAGYRRSRGRAE